MNDQEFRERILVWMERIEARSEQMEKWMERTENGWSARKMDGRNGHVEKPND